jgi:eukaryotic-like serine/threonine-protein kinase
MATGKGRGVRPLTSDDPAEIGGYRLRGRLGAGGMGRVYLASTSAGRLVALKVVRPELGDDQEFRARFRREIEAARRVHGLYTAQVVDADPDAVTPWLVTAYVPGPSLEQAILKNGPMPEAMVFRLIAGVAEALQAIHAAGVVHRDLKPSNVLLAEDGPRVIDFGIAQALEAVRLTHSDIMMGSAGFMAPEQILDRPVSPAIDVFVLGALAVYAAAGRSPFGDGQQAAVSHRVVYEPPNLDGCPTRMLTLIEACLEKEPQARPSPGRILEFCAERAADMPGSSQPWRAWGQPGAEPEPAERAASSAPVDVIATPLPRARPGAAVVMRRRRGAIAVLGAAVIVIATAGIVAVATITSPGSGKTVRGSTVAHETAVAQRPVATTARTSTPHPADSPSRQPQRASPSPVQPVVLLSQGKPATASSVEGYPWVAANAVDGNFNTRWSSAWSDPQWLEVDLEATYNLSKVVLYWENPAYATAFQIQVSDNGTTWTAVYSTTTGTGGEQTVPVDATGRYVRMYGTHRATGYGYSLWEFQVFGN